MASFMHMIFYLAIFYCAYGANYNRVKRDNNLETYAWYMADQASQDDCRYQSLCDTNAMCLPNAQQKYTCYCDEGYEGDGFRCTSLNSQCGQQETCPANAICVSFAENNQYHCVCKDGYRKQGEQCVFDETSDCLTQPICDENADCVSMPANRTVVLENLKQPQRSPVSHCICKPGFTGDGLTCVPMPDSCIKDSDCGLHGQCLAEHLLTIPMEGHPILLPPVPEAASRRRCGCIADYFRHPAHGCIPINEVTCELVPNCHEQASCKFNVKKHKYECDCNENYRGDGKHCEPLRPQCDVHNNCDPKATCKYNQRVREYECVCGQGYTGDGYNCRPLTSCKYNSSLCDVNADCVYSTQTRYYQCVCKASYLGNGFVCNPVTRHGPEHIIFSQGKSLLNLPLDKKDANAKQFGSLVLTRSDQTPIGLDVDCVEGQVYWADVTGKGIHRSYYNGTYMETILQSDYISPEGIAIDWLSRNIYFTDPVRDVIEVLKLNGNDQKVLINTDLVDPRGIAVHPGIGKLYWTDWNRADPKIEQANMDGTGRQVLVSGNLGLPNMLTVDYKNDDLCWTDAMMKRIECIKLSNSNRRIIYTPAQYPFDLTVIGNFIYWTDWQRNNLYKVHRNGGEAEALTIPLGGHGKLYGIVSASSQCVQMSNACAVDNGQCKYLCLPTSEGARSCLCPDHPEKGAECGNSVQ